MKQYADETTRRVSVHTTHVISFILSIKRKMGKEIVSTYRNLRKRASIGRNSHPTSLILTSLKLP